MAQTVMNGAGPTRIIVVEDSGIFRAALVDYLNAQPGCVVSGTAHCSAEARALAALPAPDVVTLDLGLPDGGGLHLIGPLLEKWPHTKIIVLSIDDTPRYRDRSLAAGAHGYVNKREAIEQLMPVIQLALSTVAA